MARPALRAGYRRTFGVAALVAMIAVPIGAHAGPAAPAKPAPPHQARATMATGAVPAAQARQALDRMHSAGVVSWTPGAKYDGSKPVTRDEMVIALDHWARYIEASHKPLTPTARPKPKLPKRSSAAANQAMIHLATGGFLPPSSVLFKGTGKELVTADQFTKTLTFVIVGITSRSQPALKFD